MTRNEKKDNKVIEIVNKNEQKHIKNENTSVKEGVMANIRDTIFTQIRSVHQFNLAFELIIY